MIVLIHTIYHVIAELSMPAWQKDVRNITYEVIEAMKEARNRTLQYDVMHEIFLPRHNKPEFAYGIFNYQKHSMFLLASRWQKKIDKLLWIHVLHEVNDIFRYWYFFCFSVFHKGKYCFSSVISRVCSFRFPLALLCYSFSSTAHCCST